MSGRLQIILLRMWHAWLAGGFLVTYLTGDEDTYAMHVFAGYAVLAAVVARLALAAIAPANGPLALPRPRLGAIVAWLGGTARGRHPLLVWFAASLVPLIGLAAMSGVAADAWSAIEKPHEVIAELSLWLVLGHVGFVSFLHGGKRAVARLTAALAGSIGRLIREVPR